MTQHMKKMTSLVAGLFILGTTWAQDTRAFNQNASRSNHTHISYTIHEHALQTAERQNNNTVRSNRGELTLVLADLDGDGIYETNISSRMAGKITFEGRGTLVVDHKPVAVIVNPLKVKHDTVKNSIGNIR
ncbi:hypothetical protein LL912_14940 [Niabella sp. CC-SYL272]|uniref:hypothetical protein n=1 Tax=Niabella agricola TaxID=2891571 RepID=UPI001F31F65F|nr:hypothetical protein [Niabella agricola]MCF3110076.1 hypothetical protein [Niabella agricola]